MKIARKMEAEKAIQDFRVTKRQKGEKREREVQILPMKNPDGLTEDEKLVRTLKKKLRAIDDLITRKNEGAKLDDKQTKKVAKLPMLLKEMEKVLLRITSSAGIDIGDSEDDDDDE